MLTQSTPRTIGYLSVPPVDFDPTAARRERWQDQPLLAAAPPPIPGSVPYPRPRMFPSSIQPEAHTKLKATGESSSLPKWLIPSSPSRTKPERSFPLVDNRPGPPPEPPFNSSSPHHPSIPFPRAPRLLVSSPQAQDPTSLFLKPDSELQMPLDPIGVSETLHIEMVEEQAPALLSPLHRRISSSDPLARPISIIRSARVGVEDLDIPRMQSSVRVQSPMVTVRRNPGPESLPVPLLDGSLSSLLSSASVPRLLPLLTLAAVASSSIPVSRAGPSTMPKSILRSAPSPNADGRKVRFPASLPSRPTTPTRRSSHTR